jgi:hypothetical protein
VRATGWVRDDGVPVKGSRHYCRALTAVLVDHGRRADGHPPDRALGSDRSSGFVAFVCDPRHGHLWAPIVLSARHEASVSEQHAGGPDLTLGRHTTHDSAPGATLTSIVIACLAPLTEAVDCLGRRECLRAGRRDRTVATENDLRPEAIFLASVPFNPLELT